MQTHADFQHNQHENADIASTHFIEPEKVKYELQDSLKSFWVHMQLQATTGSHHRRGISILVRSRYLALFKWLNFNVQIVMLQALTCGERLSDIKERLKSQVPQACNHARGFLVNENCIYI